MRAKVAAHAGGHAFEKRFLELDDVQLTILYNHVLTHEHDKKQELYDIIKTVNSAWVQNFKNLFEDLHFFVNPDLFNRFMELKDEKKFKQEVNEENFNEEWSKILEEIPSVVTVDYAEDVVEIKTKVDPEIDELIAGFVPYHKKRR